MTAGFDRRQLIADLTNDEGLRLVAYDDADPKAQVGPGYTIKGNLTVGIGHALQRNPLTPAQAAIICGWDIDAKAVSLYDNIPWLDTLSEARQRAVMNMAFNLGIGGLLGFTNFLGLLKAGNYAGAADDLMSTPWAKQVGNRAASIEALIRHG